MQADERTTTIQAFLPKIEADIRRRAYTDRPPRVFLGFISLGWQRSFLKRRNEHFTRERSFYSHVIGALGALGRSTDDSRLTAKMEVAAGLLQKAAKSERKWNPWLLDLPAFMKEFRGHSLYQLQLNDMIAAALTMALSSPVSIEGEPVRPSSARIVGVAAADMRKHFAQQAIAEDQILYYLKILSSEQRR